MSRSSVQISERVTSPNAGLALGRGRDATLAIMPSPIITRALTLDREADAELAMGHHAAAERLAWRAAELRGWA